MTDSSKQQDENPEQYESFKLLDVDGDRSAGSSGAVINSGSRSTVTNVVS